VSYSAVIRLGPLVSEEALRDPASEERGRDIYQRGAMSLVRDAPVLVNHLDGLEVGSVEELWEWNEGPGGWLVARCTITAELLWLRVGTKASVGWAPLRHQAMRDGGWNRVLRGLVTEVSILTPDIAPADRMAQVVLLNPLERVATVATSSVRSGSLDVRSPEPKPRSYAG
jgi:hypothetical protein